MSRNKEFHESNERPVFINDSRFGLRKFYLNENEKSHTLPYSAPGRGANGESST
jgi:hypothetical protein